MYQYDGYDQKIVDERVAQFKDQTQRYLAGELSEEQYLPLRLQNGLYVQRFAPMLRVAVPYGLLSSNQVRKLAHIARTYDKGYAHISTRTNFQFNWPKLETVPDILEELASVQMHAIQTSGNCIRNTTTDQFAGVVKGEIVDPRPYCEIIRQWSTFHPEFAFLPRKFKIAVNSHETDDRAATLLHDVAIKVKLVDSKVVYDVYVGGGLGRTPIIASLVEENLAEEDLLTYLDAVLRVYNLHGRRDNKYKARIKILVKALGVDAFRSKVHAEWERLKGGPGTLTQTEINRIKGHFTAPEYRDLDDLPAALSEKLENNKAFSNWYKQNVHPHKVNGYAIVSLTLKKLGVPPGDITDKQLDVAADLADQYSFGEIRSTHEQNLVLADVEQTKLYELWEKLKENGFATPNLGLLTDMICCPGGDFCALANAKSIPVAEALQETFDDLDYLHDIGEIDLNISGCMNACGHHHIGHIGILGVDKKGEEFYQISLGGNSGPDASLGKILGPSFARADMANVIKKIIETYIEKRVEGERFIETYQRLGHEVFKERVYAKSN